MINQIFVEREIENHHRVKSILERFASLSPIYIDHYGELFNKKNQNFRVQKSFPNLILAKKNNGHVLQAPENFGIGDAYNFYFSHMYNCLYDCDYCFLQGMYSSADFVLFVNYEKFEDEIVEKIKQLEGRKVTFFSGYDCDSLAFEKISGFVEHFLPIFEKFPNALLELRTKSIQQEPLVFKAPIQNCVIAYSLMPGNVAKQLDRKAPSIEKRIKALEYLAKKGWQIGLRFDPLIYGKDWKVLYSDLFKDIFKRVAKDSIHSVTFGPLRFPKEMFKNLVKLNPESKLLSGPLTLRGTKMTYNAEIELEMINFCENLIKLYVPGALSFTCRGDF